MGNTFIVNRHNEIHQLVALVCFQHLFVSLTEKLDLAFVDRLGSHVDDRADKLLRRLTGNDRAGENLIAEKRHIDSFFLVDRMEHEIISAVHLCLFAHAADTAGAVHYKFAFVIHIYHPFL